MQVICNVERKLSGKSDGIWELRCADGEKMLGINHECLACTTQTDSSQFNPN